MRRQGEGWIKETFLSCIIGKVVRVKSLYAWQFMPATAELWKLKQEDCHGFKPNTEFQINLSHNETLSYLLSPKSKKSSAQQCNFLNPVSYFCTLICSNTFFTVKNIAPKCENIHWKRGNTELTVTISSFIAMRPSV